MEGLNRLRRCAVPFFLGVLAGCGGSENIIATVGGHRIDVTTFQGYLEASTGMSWQISDGRVASRLLDQYLDQEVVAVAAEIRHDTEVPVDPAERSALVRSLLDEVCGSTPPIEQERVDREVVRRLDQVRPARAHVRQLLLATVEEADAARRRLDEGEGFDLLSRSVSRAPNAQTGGELGYVVQGTLPQDLDEVIFGLEPGEISQPVSSPAGHHIFQVLDVIPAGPPSRTEVEVATRNELTEESVRAFTRECVERLGTEIGVVVYGDHLWFEYEGWYGRIDGT
jgi:parvulin-like peptidyl-prolyl isomerase